MKISVKFLNWKIINWLYEKLDFSHIGHLTKYLSTWNKIISSITYSVESLYLASWWYELKSQTFSVLSLTCLFLSLPPKPRIRDCGEGGMPAMKEEGVGQTPLQNWSVIHVNQRVLNLITKVCQNYPKNCPTEWSRDNFKCLWLFCSTDNFQ